MARAQDVLARRIGVQQAERLATARVGIAGLGGLGSNIAVHLVRSGVGALHLVDFDVVDESNLNRQHYFRSHLGRRKTEALAVQLKDVNPDVELALDAVRVEPGAAVELFAGERFVCEAFDRPAAKAMLVNELLADAPRTVVVAASGLAGVGAAREMVTRRISRRFYVCGDGESDIADGAALFAPRVALCAAQQALVVVRLILGLEGEEAFGAPGASTSALTAARRGDQT